MKKNEEVEVISYKDAILEYNVDTRYQRILKAGDLLSNKKGNIIFFVTEQLDRNRYCGEFDTIVDSPNIIYLKCSGLLLKGNLKKGNKLFVTHKSSLK